MPAEKDATRSDAYLNPVHARDFPDPYVLKFAGEYFAYCTGFWQDGRCFGVMRSRDLVRWEELAGALAPLPGGHTCYWAPEVSYRNGKFLMYYSVGNETRMQVRVAVADDPSGPFVDSGHTLTREEFAIDPHVFVDTDGARYLFYATDFLTHTHIGTGTVVDRMLDDFTLEGRARPVTRALYDWQVYDPHRKEKGGVRWHTVEGPFVLKRKNRYYEMFSGGNWQNVSYGVSYATSDQILKDEEWEQNADGLKVLPILRTIPDKVVGPGHNSVVRAPDNQQLFCVYHRWSEQGRVLAIDRQEFVGDALSVLGPTTTPQPAPIMPSFADYFDEPRNAGLGDGWECASGRWSVREGEARQEANEGVAEARCCSEGGMSFIAELSFRALETEEGGTGTFGVLLYDDHASVLRFVIEKDHRRAALSWQRDKTWVEGQGFYLPTDFDPCVLHQLRIEVDVMFICLSLDDYVVRWEGAMEFEPEWSPVYYLSLFAENCAAAFAGFALTHGFTDEFISPASSISRGWRLFGGEWYEEQELQIRDGRLWIAKSHNVSKLARVTQSQSYELVVNVKAEGVSADESRLYGIVTGGLINPEMAMMFFVERAQEGDWSLALWQDEKEEEARRLSFPLPPSFDPFEFQQFRFRLESGRIVIQLGSMVLGETETLGSYRTIGVSAWEAGVMIDLIRLTAI